MNNSTYINVYQGILPEYADSPPSLKDFIKYLRTRKNRSEATVNSYYKDLRLYVRFLMVSRGLLPSYSGNDFENVDISKCPDDIILSAKPKDIDDFLYFSVSTLRNAPQTMARKLSAIKTFYRYLCKQAHLISVDPSVDVEGPNLKKNNRQPVYLTYEQCLQLLNSIDTESSSRDYCIISVFLNTGIRISELVGLDMKHINLSDGKMKVLGKGNKERDVYLNNAAQVALKRYLEDRALYRQIIDEHAVFVSERTGRRLTARGIEVMVEKVLSKAGLGGLKFSPHKFRHTAATMMYGGGTDILAVSKVLGHESVATSEIYTHLQDKTLKEAVASSPLSSIEK